MRRRHLATTICALSAVVGLPATAALARSGGLPLSPFQASAGAPKVTVRVDSRGTETDPGFAYKLRVRCTTDGAPVAPATGFDGTFPLTAGETRSFGRDEFPSLALSSTCSFGMIDSNGAPITYATTLRARTDGSRPTPQPGLITTDGYVSAPAGADGQTVTVAVTFSGDLAIAQRVSGAPEGIVATYETRITCSDAGYSNTVALTDGQLQILTGIPAGSTCTVSQAGSGAARFEDNSGNPGDATVTITGTRSDCWDLRNVSAACRATVVVTNNYDNRFTDPDIETEEAPTTTAPNNQDAPATTAAPAVTPAPAFAVEAVPAFAG